MSGNATAPTSDKWQHFERLVAAIHQVASQGAEVRWNEKIAGRQFDVTIRFRQGLYDYLTVVECKDYEKAVPVEKVEAFVTKAADVQAHYAVMASTSPSPQTLIFLPCSVHGGPAQLMPSISSASSSNTPTEKESLYRKSRMRSCTTLTTFSFSPKLNRAPSATWFSTTNRSFSVAKSMPTKITSSPALPEPA